MCFLIDSLAKPWRNQMVYKVVAIRNGVKTSSRSGRFYYRDGKTVTCGRDERSRRGNDGTLRTLAGIYVCKTLSAARRYYSRMMHDSCSRQQFAIIKLGVQQEHFLFAADAKYDSDYTDVATYRRAVVLPGYIRKVRARNS